MTAYRVIDDHKELDNVGSLTHDQIDSRINTTPFIIVSGAAGDIPPNARLLTGSGIAITDNGPGGTLVLTATGGGGGSPPGGLSTYVQFNDGGIFGGDSSFTFNKLTNTLAVDNISGSLTTLVDGSSYLIGGSGISILSGANGSITISTNASGTITAVNAGLGLSGGGTSGSVTLNINDSIVATVSGATFTGPVIFSQGLSGSLTRLENGGSFLVAGSNITIVSSSNGQVTISSTATGGGGSGDPNASYLVLSTTGSLTNERAFVAGTGLLATDGGSNNNYTLAISDAIVATVSGATFTGATKHNLGISGSLTRLTDGTSYLVAGPNILITSASNGSITIEASGGGGGGGSPGGFSTYVQFNDGGSFGGDANFTFNKNTSTLSVDNISGSLTRLVDGTPYLIAGPNITISTGSNGAVTIAASATTYTRWLEVVGGDADGVNTAFTLSNTPFPASSTMLFVNGVLQRLGSGLDYTITGNTINTNWTPNSGSYLLATYQYQTTLVPGSATAWMENPAGPTNGINNIFTLSTVPNPSSSLMLFVNGVLQKPGVSSDYTLTGNTITMTYPPNNGSTLTATYQYQLAPLVGSSTQFMEVPLGDVDGVNMLYTISNIPIPTDSLMFFVNGVLQRQGLAYDYTLSGNTIMTISAPSSGSNVLVTYPY